MFILCDVSIQFKYAEMLEKCVNHESDPEVIRKYVDMINTQLPRVEEARTRMHARCAYARCYDFELKYGVVKGTLLDRIPTVAELTLLKHMCDTLILLANNLK